MRSLTKIRGDGGEFLSLQDFLRRVPREVINRRQIDGLIRAGALRTIHTNAGELLENIDLILSYADTIRRESESNQDSLFTSDNDLRLSQVPNWSHMDSLKEEFNALGLYLSASNRQL